MISVELIWVSIVYQGPYLLVGIALGVAAFFLEKVQRKTGRKGFGYLSIGLGLLCVADRMYHPKQIGAYWGHYLDLCDTVARWVQVVGFLTAAYGGQTLFREAKRDTRENPNKAQGVL